MTQKIVLDTNLLMLLVAGLTNPAFIAKHKRTKTFSTDDFKLLQGILRKYQKLLLTSHVLSEASNLLAQADQQTADKL